LGANRWGESLCSGPGRFLHRKFNDHWQVRSDNDLGGKKEREGNQVGLRWSPEKVMGGFDIAILVFGCVLGCILACALLVRYCKGGLFVAENKKVPLAEHDNMNYDDKKDANGDPDPYKVTVLLEDEVGEYEAFPTISQLLARSNGAYTVNVVAACLVGVVLGYDFHRPDGISTIPNLFVAGLLVVLLSPGDQTNPRQWRIVCCVPLQGGCRGVIHAIGFILFAVGLILHIIFHSYMIHTCDDPNFLTHDRVFVGLTVGFFILLVLFMCVFSRVTSRRQKAEDARNTPGAAPEPDDKMKQRVLREGKCNKCMFFCEVVIVVGALMVYFAHSMDSHYTSSRKPSCLLFT